MRKSDEAPDGALDAWQEQAEERLDMTAEDVCIKARTLDEKAAREYWLVLAVLGAFVVKAGIYFSLARSPLVKMGWAWGITTFLYIGLRWAKNGPPGRVRPTTPDACVSFLRSELDRKRERILELRLTLLLLFPGMAASWWGGGPVEVAKLLGIDADWYVRWQQSPAPVIGFALLLAAVWTAFGREARKIQGEMERIDGSGR